MDGCAAFFNHVGHDLRGELATMLAGVHYLTRYEKGFSPTAADMLDRVNGAGLRLKRLLEEFDDAVWIGGQPRELSCEGCELRPLVDAALKRVEKSAELRGVEVDVDLSAAAEPLRGDADVLGPAIAYVIDFAVARSKDQRVTVTGGMAGGATTLTVADLGGDVEPDKLAQLLEPFAEREVIPRADPSQRRRERLGMGLAIARSMLEAHGGGLRASATAGGGITLTCTLGQPAAETRRSA